MMQSHILPTPSQSKPRIAALDDEEDILELLRSTLGPAGFQLATKLLAVGSKRVCRLASIRGDKLRQLSREQVVVFGSHFVELA
ncbi:MAG: hypothetical protein J0L75_18985, partial [Spirochaetes bacterium]|nr:hypothetical protein [Spirochaetota bacterium]